MKKSKKKLIIIIAIIIVFIIIIISVGRCALNSAADAISTTDMGLLVEPLGKHDLSASISATGTIESQSTVSVTSDLTYKISELNVSVGDYVKEGDVLCVFDADELNAQIKSLEEQLNNANALDSRQNTINNRTLNEAKADRSEQLEKAQQAINSAQNDLNRARNSRANLEEAYNNCQNQIANVQSQLAASPQSDAYLSLQEQLSQLTISSGELLTQIQELENSISSLENAVNEANSNYKSVERQANQQVQAAQDAIDTQKLTTDNSEAKKELDSLKRKLDKITVKAEHSGIITSLNVSTGSLHTGGELMKIQDTNALKLTVSIKENDILDIQEGMKATVTSNANENISIEGTVTKVVDFVTISAASNLEEGGSNQGYSAEITLPDNSGFLLGMTAKAKIIISDADESIAVAYDSIFYDEDENAYVYRANPTNKDGKYEIEKIRVEKGQDSDYYTGISSSELSEGDYIVSFPEQVSEGDITEVDETYMTDGDGE